MTTTTTSGETALDLAFGKTLRTLFGLSRPRRLVETGTYLGLGSTRAICQALAANELSADQFYSIEVNPNYYAKAWDNLSHQAIHPRLLRGLSIPRALVPAAVEKDPETYFPEALDDLLGYILRFFDHAPDFVLLDSASQLGMVEFQYALSLIKGPCHVALHNIQTTHRNTLQCLLSDQRFKLLELSQAQSGYCVAHFVP